MSGDLLFRKYDGGSQRLRGRGEPKAAERVFQHYTADDDVAPPAAAPPLSRRTQSAPVADAARPELTRTETAAPVDMM